MSRLYSCIISSSNRPALVGVARQFAYAIQTIDDGIVFDISGLERLIGKRDRVEQRILAEMEAANVSGCVAVADTVDTAILLARQSGKQNEDYTLNTPDKFLQLPLKELAIEQDTLNVFNELGLHTAGDLLAVPHDELVGRYGRQFTDVIDVLEQKGRSLITSNIKENRVSWSFELDNPVEDFEQLIFLLNHGLERLFAQVEHAGFSTEHLDLKFRLRNKTEKTYEIKTSFPTLERSFWLKLINLRAALDPPEELITAVNVVAHFTRPRPDQRGLYAASRPESESLLLTVNKLRKLVGEDNVGVPVLLDQRAAEPFTLDAEAIPDVSTDILSKRSGETPLGRSICGRLRRSLNTGPLWGQNAPLFRKHATSFAAMPPCHESGGIAARNIKQPSEKQSVLAPKRASVEGTPQPSANRAAEPQETEPLKPIITFNYYRPPIRAEVLVRDRRLIFVKTRQFAAHIVNCSGVWKGNSRWWDQPWRTLEWDIEVENQGIYRLCKAKDEWFLTGEYD